MAKNPTSKPTNDSLLNEGMKAIITAAKLTAANDDVDEAKAALKIEKELGAKRDVDIKALEYVMKVRKAGTQVETAKFLRNVLMMLHAFGDGIEKSQLEIWNLLETALPLDEKAYDNGKVAGVFGNDTGDNPYDVSSSAGQQWLSGLADGRAALDEMNRLEAEAAADFPDIIKTSGDPFNDGNPDIAEGEAPQAA